MCGERGDIFFLDWASEWMDLACFYPNLQNISGMEAKDTFTRCLFWKGTAGLDGMYFEACCQFPARRGMRDSCGLNWLLARVNFKISKDFFFFVCLQSIGGLQLILFHLTKFLVKVFGRQNQQ